jgi:hypothetical protein
MFPFMVRFTLTILYNGMVYNAVLRGLKHDPLGGEVNVLFRSGSRRGGCPNDIRLPDTSAPTNRGASCEINPS